MRFLIFLIVTTGTLLAQTGTGVVRGTVQDASKAAVPNAKVTLTNRQINVTQVSKSSAEGLYYFGSLPPASYAITVEIAGFKKWNGEFTLQAGQTAVVDYIDRFAR